MAQQPPVLQGPPNGPNRTAYQPKGYHRLARLTSKDRSAAIFHRFDDILLLQLLDLQAEIHEMRCIFQAQCEWDDGDTTDPERAMFSTSFRKLRRNPTSLQRTLLIEMREKLTVYNRLLLQASQLATLPSPRKRDLSELRSWLQDSKGGDGFQRGIERDLWKEGVQPCDLISLNPSSGDADYFTELLTSFVVNWVHRLFGDCCDLGKVIDEESGSRSYSESRINAVSKVISTVASSILPVVTILVLYKIQSTWWRIGASILFTALFALFLSVFSKAKRVEIFAATATFAAVEVVFIGNALNKGS